MVKIVGHISKPVVGEGRNAPDRQMFFVNGRPCMLPQIAKAINEVYKGFNVTQSPFIFADIQLDTGKNLMRCLWGLANGIRRLRCECLPGQENNSSS